MHSALHAPQEVNHVELAILAKWLIQETWLSIAQVLKATKVPDLSSGNTLYNPTNNFNWRQGEGSEFYKGEWSRFIQIILSTSLVNNQLGSDGAFHDIHIFHPEWLLKNDDAYQQMIPERTYEGEGKPVGFSDHLPVYINLQLN